MAGKKFSRDGTRLTDCCGAYSTYIEEQLCCRQCLLVVPEGQGDGTETLDGPISGEKKRRIRPDEHDPR